MISTFKYPHEVRSALRPRHNSIMQFWCRRWPWLWILWIGSSQCSLQSAATVHLVVFCFLWCSIDPWGRNLSLLLLSSPHSTSFTEVLQYFNMWVFEQDLPHVAVQPHASEKRRLRNPDVLRRGKSFRPLTSGLTIEEGNKGRTLITVPESNQNLSAGIQHVSKHQVICDNLIYNTDLSAAAAQVTLRICNFFDTNLFFRMWENKWKSKLWCKSDPTSC